MKTVTLPVLLLLPMAGMAVLVGGTQGAGVIALLGVFLVGFTLLLLRGEGAQLRVSRKGFNPRREADVQFMGFLILTGAMLRVIAALAMRQAGINEAIAPDEYTFHDNGRFFLGWLEGEFDHPFSYRWYGITDVGYFAVVGTLYGIFGVYEVVPVLFNCVIGALCAIPAYRLGARIGGRVAGRFSAGLVTFFPSLILWSTLLIRDAPALFLILWSVVFTQELMRRFRLSTLVWLIFCLALLSTFRAYLFVLVASGGVVAFLVAGIRRPGRAVLAAAAAGIGAILLVKGMGLGADTISRASLEHIAARRHWNSFGAGSIGTAEFDLSTPTGALTYLPVGMMWFLLSPFPWQSSGRQAMAIPDVLLWYVCIPLVVMGVAYGLRRRRRMTLAPLLAASLITVLHSLWEGNVGIIFRHRAHVLVLLLPFVGVAVQRLRARAVRREAALRRARGLVVGPRTVRVGA